MMPPWLAPHDTLTYQEYLAEMERYARLDPSSGPTELARQHLAHGPLNLQRMNRIGKSFAPSAETVEQMQKIIAPQFWMVLSELWCGDSAQCLPVIARVAASNPRVDLRMVLRDSHPDVMNRFLTDGKRSIPKLVAFSEEREVLFQWGPRPAAAMEVVARARAEGMSKREWEERLHLWFAKDRGAQVELELRALVVLQIGRGSEIPEVPGSAV